MSVSIPRLVVAGLSGDSGKTIISLSLLTAFRKRGLSVAVFKKGPDYIDSAWLSLAAHSECRNLDTYLVDPDDVYETFTTNACKSNISVIEGNRGLYDSKDPTGAHSTAELAKLLKAPTLLVVNVSKTTRTVAAIVNGCLAFDPDVEIVGIILNKVAGERHRKIIEDCIKDYCGLPVLGAVPNLDDSSSLIPNRHLGLVTPSEFKHRSALESQLTEIADKYLDIERLIEIAGNAINLQVSAPTPHAKIPIRAKIGFFKDAVFTFYYPENLEALRANGTEITPVSAIDDKFLPDIDALYIGGGFPETHAERLAQNKSMMQSVKKAAMEGLPIYAECGGLIYLSKSLRWKDKLFPMTGVFPVELKMHEKPIGHGYTILQVDRPNPFFEVGAALKGHEFHYTGPIGDPQKEKSCMRVERGVGLGCRRDGLLYNSTLACYTHIHARGVKIWAGSMVSSAQGYNSCRQKSAFKNKGGCCSYKYENLKKSNEPVN